ncbi:MAG: hypothetical protein ACM3XM_17800 [Mycobacterium leprae]
MVMAVVGLAYGSLVGMVNHWLLFWRMNVNRRRRKESLADIGFVFLLRYLIDGTALLLFALALRNGAAITAAALSITVTVKISLLTVYLRKGGKFD